MSARCRAGDVRPGSSVLAGVAGAERDSPLAADQCQRVRFGAVAVLVVLDGELVEIADTPLHSFDSLVGGVKLAAVDGVSGGAADPARRHIGDGTLLAHVADAHGARRI